MNEDIRELTSIVLSHITQNSLITPPIMHGTAGANFAVVARITDSNAIGQN